MQLSEPSINTLSFYIHEKFWHKPKLKAIAFYGPHRKTLSFAIVHFNVAFVVIYALTGDVIYGSLLALIEPMCNSIAFHSHEYFWRKSDDIPKHAAHA